MPYVTRVSENGFEITLMGVTDGEEIVTSMSDGLSRIELTALRFRIIDARAVEAINAEPAHFKLFREMDEVLVADLPRNRFAMVGTAPHVVPMMEAYMNGPEKSNIDAMIFEQITEARRWTAAAS